MTFSFEIEIQRLTFFFEQNFIFSNTGSTVINKMTLDYQQLGIDREKYDILLIQKALANAAYTETGLRNSFINRRSGFSLLESIYFLGASFSSRDLSYGVRIIAYKKYQCNRITPFTLVLSWFADTQIFHRS